LFDKTYFSSFTMATTTADADAITCRLQHHGAAAASNRKVLTWIPRPVDASSSSNIDSTDNSDSTDNDNDNKKSMLLVYPSHAMLNIVAPTTVLLGNGMTESVWRVQETLRTEQVTDGKTVITCVSTIKSSSDSSSNAPTFVACGFSDGSISLWRRSPVNAVWTESVVLAAANSDTARSVTDLAGVCLGYNLTSTPDTDAGAESIVLVAGSSTGAILYRIVVNDSHNTDSKQAVVVTSETLMESQIAGALSVRPVVQQTAKGSSSSSSSVQSVLVCIGTAAPRHNKIHVYTVTPHDSVTAATASPSTSATATAVVHYHGFLAGHEDWITCLDWYIPKDPSQSPVLASASQDYKIRLWKFTTTTTTTTTPLSVASLENPNEDDDVVDDDDDDEVLNNDDEEEDEEGESRMEIINTVARTSTVTSVTLEALLIGHEDSVTSVSWHPNPKPTYGKSMLLISSSMDRTVLLWTSGSDGIWTPLSRVGSAGGILGGSVGSTLLGFVRTAIEPVMGQWLVGHAFGGALHFWRLDDTAVRDANPDDLLSMEVEERATLVNWRATPCLTGHFGGVTDLCWETSTGEYLLTVSVDQTCRLWGMVPSADTNTNTNTDTKEGRGVWAELARPQVHGYDLSAVTSLSTPQHPHLIVTGADEKELRVFDAPLTTLRTLKAVCGTEYTEDTIDRTERAYIPSLGLSNQASAADGADEDKNEETEDARVSLENASLEKMRLPLERDLGAVSLWPEIRKLFGHNTELYCLTSTLAARTAGQFYKPPSDTFLGDVIVASSAKARIVEDASIRLWNVERGKCLQVLEGGHKSTIATLSFSPDGRYLASSGKDRRLCLWRRDETTREFALAYAKDSAHKRIIWSVHFCPFHESILASGSRDGCIKLWKVQDTEEGGAQAVELYSFAPCFRREQKPDAVTALSFAPVPFDQDVAILALGLESGRIEIWKVPLSAEDSSVQATLVLNVDPFLCHIATVTKLAWRPHRAADGDASSKEVSLVLASSSLDHGCRIFEISW
jgi:elongator complex protein 2